MKVIEKEVDKSRIQLKSLDIHLVTEAESKIWHI